MYTINEAINKFYNRDVDYEHLIHTKYDSMEYVSELAIEDKDNLLYAIKQLREYGKTVYIVSTIESYDTMVRDMFIELLKLVDKEGENCFEWK